jgi:hypothetical protein
MDENPFVATTTPAIERANRLIAVRSHPGFLDILRISQDLISEADEACRSYPGWDLQQILVLKVRMQCAQEHHKMLLAKIQDAVDDGVAEAKRQMDAAILKTKTPAEIVEQGDYVRQAVLTKFDEMDSRASGSFGPKD